MKKRLFWKELVLGMIFLFVGAGFQPVFANVNAETDETELVEITIQICWDDGADDYTLMLSQEQAEELEKLLNITKSKLDSVETLEETSLLFNNFVLSLYDLGVLPDDISIEDAKRLISVVELNPIIARILEKWYNSNLGILDIDENLLCLIAGYSDNTYFHPPLFDIVAELIEDSPLLMPLLLLYVFTLPFWLLNPLPIGNSIYLGSYIFHGMPVLIPAIGWVHTIGLNGIKSWNGTLVGNLGTLLCRGVQGFTGIRIGIPLLSYFYLGTALKVKIL